jgi:hypothetical protein
MLWNGIGLRPEPGPVRSLRRTFLTKVRKVGDSRLPMRTFHQNSRNVRGSVPTSALDCYSLAMFDDVITQLPDCSMAA